MMRISTRIICGLTLMVALVLGSSLYTYQATTRLTTVVGRLLRQELPALAQVDELQTQFTVLHTLENRILAENAPDDHQAFEKLLRQTHILVLEVEPLPYLPESIPLVAEFKSQANLFLDNERETIRWQDADDLFNARRMSSRCMSERLSVAHLCSQLQTMYKYFLQDKELSNQHLAEELGVTSISIALISIVVAVLLAFGGVRSLLNPLQHLLAITQHVSMGKFDRLADEHTPDEWGRLGHSFNLMVGNLHSRILEVAQKNRSLQEKEQTMQQELRLAQQVQRNLVPRQPTFPGMHISARIQPAQNIGGDFYDVQAVDGSPGQVGMVIGDASGHGIAAALMMVMTVTIVREASRLGLQPSEVLQWVNRGLREQFPDETVDMFVTAAYMVFDLQKQRMRYAVAGHEPPIVWRASDNSLFSLDSGGLMLACFDDAEWQTADIDLHPGDKLIVYTDGLTECRDRKGGFFGRDRLEELISRHGTLEASELASLIWEDVLKFRGDQEQADDIALVIAAVSKEAEI